MDAVDLLTSQHREMEALLKKVLDAGDSNTTGKLFSEAADKLTTQDRLHAEGKPREAVVNETAAAAPLG